DRDAQGVDARELATGRRRDHRRLGHRRAGQGALRRVAGAEAVHPHRPAAQRKGGLNMSSVVTSGTWKPTPGREQAFVEEWVRFADWASVQPGAGRLQLARDLHEDGRYVSFGDWASEEAVRSWKSSPEFKERMAQVLQHVGEFRPVELGLVATAESSSN